MSKITFGQRVKLHYTSEQARQSAIHILDEKNPIFAEVIHVNVDDTVNLIVIDHVGSLVPLLNITTKEDDSKLYVSSETKK